MRDYKEAYGAKLSDEEKEAIRSFCEKIEEALGENLLSVSLYGSAAASYYVEGRSDINLLIVTEELGMDEMDRILDAVAVGRRYGINPFLISKATLESSVDVFPLKFITMRENGKLLYGQDLLSGLDISGEYVRLRCEQEIKNLSLRLKRFYIFNSGKRLDDKVRNVAGVFIDVLRVALSIGEESLLDREKAIAKAAERGIDADTIKQALELQKRAQPIPQDEARDLFGRFLAVIQSAARLVDEMKPDDLKQM